MDAHIRELIRLYEGKAHCYTNLDQDSEAAASNILAGFHYIENQQEQFLSTKLAAAQPPRRGDHIPLTGPHVI